MKLIPARNTGIASLILAVVILLVIYTLTGTVDLVFRKDGREVHRIEDASVFADLSIPDGESKSFYYSTELGEKQFSDSVEFRIEIAKTVLTKLINFEWEEMDSYIILNQR